MTLTGATTRLVVVVAVSSAAWSIYSTAHTHQTPLPWASLLVAVLPHAAAVAAAILVERAPAWWQRAGLAYVAAFSSVETGSLAQFMPFASQYETQVVVWGVATSALAMVTTVLAVVSLRRGDAPGDRSVPGVFRWVAVGAGLLLVASSLFAWSHTLPSAETGFWVFVPGATTGILMGTLVGMAVIAGITAVVAISSDRALVAGATAGLLVSHPLAPIVFADRTWRDANSVLVAGWWMTLVAQVLLVLALWALLRAQDRGAARAGSSSTTGDDRITSAPQRPGET